MEVWFGIGEGVKDVISNFGWWEVFRVGFGYVIV